MGDRISIFFERVAIALMFIISINRIVFGPTSLESSVFIKTISEILWWLIIICLFIWIEKKQHNLAKFLIAWKKNWLVMLFIVIAILSLLWTVNLPASIYKVIVLVASSLVAAYIAVSIDLKKFITGLCWYFGIVVFLSFAIALLFPAIGIHDSAPDIGAWRGIFSHKNFLGSFMVLGNVTFLFSFTLNTGGIIKRVSSAAFYLLTLLLVFLSHCATAMISLLFIHFLFICILIWKKLEHKLHKIHYLVFGLVFLAGVLVAYSNLDLLLGIFNRNSTLTGRLPMWSYLVSDVQSNHPIQGYGFGATWDQPNFRINVGKAIGWSDRMPVSADNGFVDVFMHLGWLGIIPFVFSVILASVRSGLYALKERTIISFFPSLILIGIFFINIALSFFLEFESFLWILLVFSLFATTTLQKGVYTIADSSETIRN